MTEEHLDLLVVGTGPTGIAIGVAAVRAGLRVLLVDRGPLCGAICKFPHHMRFFTTRDKLEIAGVPFTIPEDKPDRRAALVYYQGVARQHQLPLALYEDVITARREADGFVIETRKDGARRTRRASAVALATGYFDQPLSLGVPGEEQPWVHHRYLEPYAHFGQHVVIVGGGNTASETALDLWRNHVRVTLVVRRDALKPTVKYWVAPDLMHRIEEGSIAARFETTVREFGDREVVIESHGKREVLAADAAYVLIGYLPDADLERRCGMVLDDETLVPTFDPATCETGVPGLYVAGTLQAGRDTGRIFIENSRDHGERIVGHLLHQRRKSGAV